MASSRFGGITAIAILICGLAAGLSSRALAQVLIVGNDEKQAWDENAKPIFREPGKDTLTVIDISKPDAPRITSSIPLMNSVVGPPTNLAITPSGDIALVANSLEPLVQGWGHRLEPDNKVFLIDLKANPPSVIGTITVGKQPSGMAISPKGDLALVANRADGTISVLSIRGKDVLALDTVPVGAATDSVSAVAITPDGKHALSAKAAANKVALLTIDGQKVSYDKRDLPTGIFPYNVAVTPDGKLALTVDNGAGGGSDGNAKTVGVIDLEADPPRVIDHVTVGDSPEGLAISPKGDFAVSVEARGSNVPKTAFFYHPAGAVTALRIDGKRVTNVGSIDVGALPEAVAFSPDGQYVYVGNFIDGDLWALKVEGSKLTDTTQRIKLPGHPASMRSGPQ
jgi:DNA-binding beta-propeller fold protein YncE